jgi:NTE family protein
MDLRVYATNLNTRRIFEFSVGNSAHIPLAMAVRASMSIPLFFEAIEIEKRIFIDGGAVFDYPIMGFGEQGLDETLGIAFARSLVTPAIQEGDLEFGFNKPLQYFQRLVEVLKTVQSPNFILNNKLRQQTILIDTGEISSFKFDLNQSEKAFLIERGREAVQGYYQDML